MEIRNEHARFLALACERILGQGNPGDVAFTRCLPPAAVRALCANVAFRVGGWQVYGVTDANDTANRLLPGDRAVELREDKCDVPVLFLVDTAHAGAGLDGIYNASRELHEAELLARAVDAAREALEPATRTFADAAVRRATPHGASALLAPWRVFDFYTRATLSPTAVGPAVALLGLWPVDVTDGPRIEDIEVSARIADRLLPPPSDTRAPGERIEALLLAPEATDQRERLERFLREAAGQPSAETFAALAAADHAGLWLNRLKPGFVQQDVKKLILEPWTNKQKKPFAWSGLDSRGADGLLEYRVAPAPEEPGADQPTNRKPLEIRWRVEPSGLTRGRVDYRVAVVTADGTAVAEDTLSHSGSDPQKFRFQPSRFDDLPENAKLVVRARVSVIGSSPELAAESEDFLLLHAPTEAPPTTPSGARVRCLAEGVIACETAEAAVKAAGDEAARKEEPSGTITFTPVEGQTYYRVTRPALVRRAEEEWERQPAEIGRWRAWTRADGMWDHRRGLEFEPLSLDSAPNAEKLRKACADFVKETMKRRGVIGRVSAGEDKVGREYVKQWTDALTRGPAELALAHTVEVRLPSGQRAGLLVLPSHPVRVAWQMGYDQLALHCRYNSGLKPREIREALAQLDSDSFPATLPGPDAGTAYVFGALLGLSVVAMVTDTDPEPRSTVALLARCLGGEGQEDDTAAEAARAVAREIRTYLDFHDPPRVLRVNAERPGDGSILVRALGEVMAGFTEATREGPETPFEYDLDLYPGAGAAAAMTGRYLTLCAERRRAGSGDIPESARWMFDSYTTEANIRRPRLRWSRRDARPVDRVAHVSVAFDTFRSRAAAADLPPDGPIHAYGLTSPTRRRCQFGPEAVWWESGPAAYASAKVPAHPAGAWLTNQLLDVHRAALGATARWLGGDGRWPVLRTVLSPEDRDRLDRLHRFSDWVITVDRQAAVEYFDSPSTGDTYEKYIIDCRPEREDLGALQLITSTSNLDEVRSLLDATLGRLGLSSSRQNCEFLLRHLKAISGRLAIRMVSPGTARGELVALALVQAHCAHAADGDPVWLSTRAGVFVPLDDIRDLCQEAVPQLGADGEPERQRADLLYVCRAPGKGGGLWFRFVEVKYRGERRSATDSKLLEGIPQQTQQNARRWNDFFFGDTLSDPVRILRRSRLVRVLQFYTEKARRHDLADDAYQQLAKEFDRLLEDKASRPALPDEPHRGYIFCPEVLADQPVRVDVENGDDTSVFLFGPGRLPHRPATMTPASPPVPPSETGSGATPIPTPTASPPNHAVSAPNPAAPTITAASGEALSPSADAASEVRVVLGRSVLDKGDEVGWRVSIRGNPHLMIVGLPGMGKTTCLINVCAQLQDQGIVPVVFSYHEDIDERLPKKLGARTVQFLDYNDLGFNPLRIDAPTGTAHIDSAGAMRDIFGAIFPTLGELQLSKIREAVKQSYESLGWKLNAPNTGLTVPDLSVFFASLRAETHQDKSHKTLLSRLQELDDYGAFGSTGVDRPILEAKDLVVLRVHQAPNEVMQRAFATFVFYKLYRDMFRRGVQDRLTHAVVFDEAHRAGKLQLLPTMAKECRKYGLALVLASQEVRDFHPSLFSAVANYLALRTVEQDAKALARNVAPSDQESRIVDRLKQLQKYHALFFAEGSTRPVHVQLNG